MLTLERSLDISPRSNDRAEHHQAERQQGHRGNLATKPEDLAVCNDNDGQVLEDRVDGDGEELERLGARVDHADEEDGNRVPYKS